MRPTLIIASPGPLGSRSPRIQRAALARPMPSGRDPTSTAAARSAWLARASCRARRATPRIWGGASDGQADQVAPEGGARPVQGGPQAQDRGVGGPSRSLGGSATLRAEAAGREFSQVGVAAELPGDSDGQGRGGLRAVQAAPAGVEEHGPFSESGGRSGGEAHD
eukprot:8333294-Pyramimonas_sp.AAC.1